MPTYEVTSPDGRTFEVTAPDGATQEEVLAYAQQNYQKPAPKEERIDPSAGGNTLSIGAPWLNSDIRFDTGIPTGQGLDRFLAGTGKAFADLGRGAGQAVGLLSKDDIKESNALDAPLMKTGAGRAGNITGSVASVLAPSLLLPGASTLAGSAAIGAGAGLLSPVEEGNVVAEKAKGAAIGGLLGAAGQGVGNAIGSAASKYASSSAAKAASDQAQNAVRDATLKSSIDAGYQIPPSMAGGGVTSRLFEGLSGKYKTNQLAGVRNQRVTDQLARRALGLPDDAPLTSETMQTVRRQAYKDGYAPVARAGEIKTDSAYKDALDSIMQDSQGAARSFPGAMTDDVTPAIEGLKVTSFDAGDALKATQQLRDQASAAFRVGDTALGRAKSSAAKAIEDQIERGLEAKGGDGAGLLAGFREARTKMAKAHTIEDAIREGAGSVDATKLGTRVQQGKPMTGELATIGNFANNFRSVARMPESGHANPLTIMDYAVGTAGAGTANPLLALLPAARVASRYGLLSKPVQTAMANKQYVPGLLAKAAPALDTNTAKALVKSGLLGSYLGADSP